MQNDVVARAQALLQKPSVTPHDHGCQTMIENWLSPLGFECQHMRFGEVDNLWARWGQTGPLFVFAGHTDVVPTGPVDEWRYDPFSATIDDNRLYARGAADMKSAIAAMSCAYQEILQSDRKLHGSLAMLITSDEEGVSIDGTKRVVEAFQEHGQTFDYCLVGEASSIDHLGDMIKIGRRGSLSGHLKIMGQQGHIAYPQLADNPIPRACRLLAALQDVIWDEGTEDFDPTSFQYSNIHSGTGAGNVIPGSLEVRFNFRYSPAVNAETLQHRVVELIKQHKVRYELVWDHSGEPFISQKASLVNACQKVLQHHCQQTPVLSTSGGTSDGRFIAKICPEVVEVGPINASIHKIDEHIDIRHLRQLVDIFRDIIYELMG